MSSLISPMTRPGREEHYDHPIPELIASCGRPVGFHIWLDGRMLGISLGVERVVVERVPNRVKAWETVGTPRLMVIGPYRMCVVIAPRKGHCAVTIAIDYAMPSAGWERILGRAFELVYAMVRPSDGPGPRSAIRV
jgi:hypothetical protein